jgi:predicted amidophosphoribosyltransferase
LKSAHGRGAQVNHDQLIDLDIRHADKTFCRRRAVDRVARYFRSCAVCTSLLPPIDFLCPACWRELGRLMNRGRSLQQADYVLPTYSLLTWTPATAHFVRPLIYSFKKGRTVLASQKLATLFLYERSSIESARSAMTSSPEGPGQQARDVDRSGSLFLPAPAREFDHSALWAASLARQHRGQLWPALAPEDARTGALAWAHRVRQKELRAGERGMRRFELKEHFAKATIGTASAKRIVFADDVVTSGSTAMAAYMALGDPESFEVWTLVARPRLATKVGAC